MMPWWPKDYISATRAWTLAERGAYCDLLFFQWELKYLPDNTSQLARLIGATQPEFDAVWATIKVKFVKSRKGLINRKLEQHRIKSSNLREHRVIAGRRGGIASGSKRSSKTQARLQAKGQAKSKHPSPSPSPLTEKKVASLPKSTPQKRSYKMVPESWEVTDKGRGFAESQGMGSADIALELSNFRDYEWKNAKKDFDACWRTWCRHWKKFNGERNEKDNGRTGTTFEDRTARTRARIGLDPA